MKLFPLVLAGSLVVNAAFVGLLVVGSSPDSATAVHAPRATVTGPKSAPTDQNAAAGPETWTNLPTGDLPALRDRLRDAGFPPEIVRAILTAQVNESFAARRRALTDAQAELPFWKNPTRDPKLQAALRDLGREQEKALKDLLGRDARSDDPTYAAYLRRQFGDLPADKVDRLRQIQDDYNNQRNDIYANRGGSGALLPDESQKLSALDKAMRADFAAVLTPQELADYDLRSSNTANNLRYNLSAFDATESEYRAIFDLQKSFDDKYNFRYSTGPISQDEMKARSDAQKQLQEDIKTSLGPDRYADYQRASDSSYRQTTQLVARLELPPDTAASLWNTQKEFEKRRGEIYSPATPPADRIPQLNALQQEAVARITPLLGGDPGRVEIYKQNGGSWLQSLVPRPAIPPPKQ